MTAGLLDAGREFSAGVLGSGGVKKLPRRRFKRVRGGHQCRGITFEYPAGVPGHRREQRDGWSVTLEDIRGPQNSRAQTGVAGGRGNPRTHDHPIQDMGPRAADAEATTTSTDAGE